MVASLTFARILLGKMVRYIRYNGGQFPLVFLHAGHLLLVEVRPTRLRKDDLKR
jgi:hypothetical protein